MLAYHVYIAEGLQKLKASGVKTNEEQYSQDYQYCSAYRSGVLGISVS